MLKNKRGFTLVELLAVIVILAIILAIAIPSITNITKTSRKNALEASLKMIVKGIDYKVLEGTSVTTGSAIAPTPYGASASDISTITISGTNPVTISAVAINASGKFANCSVTGSVTFTSPGTITCN